MISIRNTYLIIKLSHVLASLEMGAITDVQSAS